MIIQGFTRNSNQLTHVRRDTKLELVKAVQELEKRGFECVIPIRKGRMDGKAFKDKARYYQGKWKCGRKDFVDTYESTYYETIMRKKS